MFTGFSESAKKAVDAAREAAGPARCTECGIDHLVLGLTVAADSGAAAILEGLGVTEASLRSKLAIPADAFAKPVSFSAAALKVIEEAKEVAHRLGHEQVDTIHLLIGVVTHGADGLRALGIDPEEVKGRIAELFGVQRPGARLHPDLQEWIVEMVQAEAKQLHAEVPTALVLRAIAMAGPSAGAADEPARRLVRRAIALRHGGKVLELERQYDYARDPGLKWQILRKQAESLPAALVAVSEADLERALRDLAGSGSTA